MLKNSNSNIFQKDLEREEASGQSSKFLRLYTRRQGPAI